MIQTMALPDPIQDRYDTCVKQVAIGKWTELTILAVRDPDELLDAIDPDDFEGDERLPYWAEIWPSAIALGRHFFEHPLEPGCRLLELGCGTGVAGLAAAKAGLNVLACDYERDALAFARHNAELNNVADRISFRHLDWRDPDLTDRYPLIVGSDITYERPNHEPIRALLRNTLAPGGTFLLSDPDRRSAPSFVTSMKEAGFLHTPQPRRIRYDDKVSKITVHRFVDTSQHNE